MEFSRRRLEERLKTKVAASVEFDRSLAWAGGIWRLAMILRLMAVSAAWRSALGLARRLSLRTGRRRWRARFARLLARSSRLNALRLHLSSCRLRLLLTLGFKLGAGLLRLLRSGLCVPYAFGSRSISATQLPTSRAY